MRILLTENCNARCPNCFNASYREKRDMSIENLKKVSRMLHSQGERDIKIMGGEPTVHENFFEAIEILRLYFDSSNLFTNALNNVILDYKPREQDTITYNFNFFGSAFDTRKFLLNHPGERHLEIQIASTTNPTFLIEKIKKVMLVFDGHKDFHINFTLNCMENIFASREILIKKWNEVVSFAEKNEISWGVDHIIPECFYSGTDMIIPYELGICVPECAGLINSNLELLFCNQHPKILHKFTECNESKEYILHLLKKEYERKLEIGQDNKCKNCPPSHQRCNGGCFIHKDIYKQSIQD